MSCSVGGVGVQRRIERLERTCEGLTGTSPQASKPAEIFFLVNVLLKAALKAGRKSVLVMWLIRCWISCSISYPYALFKGLKQLTSNS